MSEDDRADRNSAAIREHIANVILRGRGYAMKPLRQELLLDNDGAMVVESVP